MTPTSLPDRRGLAMGLSAYTLWGLLPLYIHALRTVPPLQFLAHRVLWSLVLVIAIVLVTRRARELLAVARGRTLLLLFASATLIAINWGVYIWAVDTGHVLEASLGYFINPLVNVILGVAVLRERLRRLQVVAVLIAAAGVLALAIVGGGVLWISLTLAATFALRAGAQGRRDRRGRRTHRRDRAARSACRGAARARDDAGYGCVGHDGGTDALLVLAGAVTALPLLLFAAAARRLPLVTLGLLQYVAPTLQFLLAVLAFGERVLPIDRIAFPLIWAGCLVYAYDGIRAAHGARVASPE